MPLYDYYCAECSTTFEARRTFSELSVPATCPHCGTPTTRRLISTVAVFSSDSQGQVRQVAGASGCGGCAMASGCSGSCGCGSRR